MFAPHTLTVEADPDVSTAARRGAWKKAGQPPAVSAAAHEPRYRAFAWPAAAGWLAGWLYTLLNRTIR